MCVHAHVNMLGPAPLVFVSMNMLVVGVCYVYVHVLGLVPLALVYTNILEIAALVYVECGYMNT